MPSVALVVISDAGFVDHDFLGVDLKHTRPLAEEECRDWNFITLHIVVVRD